MAKNKDMEKKEKAAASPLLANARLMGLLLSGDNRAARAEARRMLADAAATDEDKAAARDVLERTGLERGTLGFGLALMAALLVILGLVFR